MRNVTREDMSSAPTEGLVVVISFFLPPIDTGVVGVVVVIAVVALVDEVEGMMMYALVQPQEEEEVEDNNEIDDDELLLLILAGADREVTMQPRSNMCHDKITKARGEKNVQ